ncbi:FtsX-like permease family protein [Clostridiaceae bacterium M8S5]|nr:FtsX-like permease family protein [Clostridiaceae bacterium M8S5]
MTISKILIKIFKADVKKYKLFVLCNLSTIAILYSFISILENNEFMDASIVDPMISSNIYAPTFLILIFAGLFIPYSQRIFIKSRQKDYGILLSLGMTEKEVRNNVLLENLILCLVSLIIGLVIGTFLSLFFLLFISDVIGVQNIKIKISMTAYRLTTIYVIAIFLISLIINVYAMIKRSIYEKIRYTEKAESGKYYKMVFVFVGIAFIVLGFIIMIVFYHINSNIWFISLLANIIGSFLIFFNGEALIECLKSKYYKSYVRNIFVFSDIRYYYGKNKKIFFMTIWIFFAVLFMISFGLITYPNFTNNAITYHPFHMVYTEINDYVRPFSNNEIEAIVRKNNNSITIKDTVRFARDNAFTIFCIEDVNKLLNKRYRIKSNSYIYVYPYDMDDGYEHNVDYNISNINIDCHKATKKFVIQDSIIDPLFGRINSISDYIILVNKEDFEWIISNDTNFYIKGKLHMYNFNDWKNSEKIVNEIYNKQLKKNNIEKKERFYKISSRIDEYKKALKSSNFLIFNIIYASLLLYLAAIIMIHFKLKMEYNSEKIKYISLYRIGIREIEVKKMIYRKIKIIYNISFLYAIIINIFYAYYTNYTYGYGKIGVFYAIITSILLFIIHSIVYKLYFKMYYKRIIKEFK